MEIENLSEEELDEALRSRSHEGDLDAYFGPELRRELGELASAEPRRDGSGHRAALRRVFILPGIMGSKLSVREADGDLNTIWIDPLDLRSGRIHDLRYGQDPDPVEATGVIYSAYLRMKYRLRWEGFEVSFLPFDWRHGIDELGNRALGKIRAEGQPVALVCHSMGGLVARKVASLASREEVPVIVTVGTPNLGSYSPVTVLRVTHEYVLLLGRLEEGNRGPKDIVERYLSRFPGLLEMMPSPLRRSGERYFDASWWPPGGVVPPTETLQAALEGQSELASPDDRFHQIIGVGQETIVGTRKHGDALQYSLSNDGDGTVPRDLAEMGEVAGRYYYPGGHAWLCNRVDIIHGAADIIETGGTDRLATRPPDERSADARSESEAALKERASAGLPRTQRVAGETVDEKMIMSAFASASRPDFPPDDPMKTERGPTPDDAPDRDGKRRSFSYIKSSEPRRRLNVDLLAGSILHAASEVYVIGLFEGVPSLGGAAGAIDHALAGALSDMLADGQITGRLGEVTFVPTPRYMLRTDHVVVVGLGPLREEMKLKAAIQLAGRNLMRALCISKIGSIATVLWGAGSGLSGRTTFGALFEGMFESLIQWDKDHLFSRIAICESDADRHARLEEDLAAVFSRFGVENCEIVLNIDTLAPGRLERALTEVEVARPRMPDSLTVQGEFLEENNKQHLRLDIAFVRGTTDSKFGGADTAAIPTSSTVIELDRLDDFVGRLRRAAPEEISNLADELRDLVFDENTRENLSLDPHGGLAVSNNPWGSRVPWELLHGRGEPIAPNGGITRRYLEVTGAVSRSGGVHRAVDRSGAVRRLLLIADPTKDLRGARKEREVIIELAETSLKQLRLAPPGGLYQSDATVEAVREQLTDSRSPVDVMHYAGHAFFDPHDRARSGLQLSGHKVLVGSEVASLARVPRVVFLNACESGRVRRGDPDDRSPDDVTGMAYVERIAGLAEAFILGGVSHLIGTIWPVDDHDAGRFARTFYESVTDVDLGRSVTNARRDLWKEGRAGSSTSWVNYIHYGEPSNWL